MKIQSIFGACAASLAMMLGSYDAHATCFSVGTVTTWVESRWAAAGGDGANGPGWPIANGDAGVNDWSLTTETNGYMQLFQNGEIWADACQSVVHGGWVHGSILTHYHGLNGGNGYMTYPTSDEMETPSNDGRVNYFEAGNAGTTGGAIYYSSASGAAAIHGSIFSKFLAYNETAAGLGYPISDEQDCGTDGAVDLCISSGRMNIMQNGYMLYLHSPSVAWAAFTVPYSGSKLFVEILSTDNTAQTTTFELVGSGWSTSEGSVAIKLMTSDGPLLETTAFPAAGSSSWVSSSITLPWTSGIPGSGAASGHNVVTFEAQGAVTGYVLTAAELH